MSDESPYSLIVDADGRPIRAVKQFGYNAIQDKDRRQAPSNRVRNEEDILTVKKRRKLQATEQEQARNHSLLQWMKSSHISYVADFRHNVVLSENKTKTGKLLDRILKWHGRPENFDIAKRHGRNEAFRLFESSKVGGGDALFIKINDENYPLKMQAIEPDRVTKPSRFEGSARKQKADKKATEKVNDSGLIVDNFGAVLQYCICKRDRRGDYVFDHLEDAENVIFDGYFTRFGGQYRGVSPLASALNNIQDIVEATEYNQLKAKLSALFGVAIVRKSVTGDLGPAGGVTDEQDGSSSSSDPTTASQQLNPQTINILDLDEGEDVKVIESATPSSEFIEGTYLFIQLALLSLDLPITAFDSRRSSFSASLYDANKYEVSCRHKRAKNKYKRQEYSDWLIESIWKDDDDQWRLRQVATEEGYSLRDVQEAIEWVHTGVPWVDQAKQIKGTELAINLRIDNSEDAAKSRGSDVRANIDKQLAVEEYERQQRIDRGLPERETQLSVDGAISRVVAQAIEAKWSEIESKTEDDSEGPEDEK
jgi:capsid protein